MSCEHCAQAVTTEPAELSAASGVTVSLVPEGTSQVTVTNDTAMPDGAIRQALKSRAATTSPRPDNLGGGPAHNCQQEDGADAAQIGQYARPRSQIPIEPVGIHTRQGGCG
jgi:copper chaperone CopZ